MKKGLLLVALLLVSQLNILKAQSLIIAPDTVCVRQYISLKSADTTASSYYWGFCSGYLLNDPVGVNLGNTFGFNLPSGIDIEKEGSNYYGFVINRATNKIDRLDYGTSLANRPIVTSFGDIDGKMPQSPNSLYIVKDTTQGYWFMFVSGGTDAGNSSVARLDFRNSLSNTPNIANFGNLGGVLNAPKGIFVAPEGGNWYGFVVNSGTNSLVRFDMGSNISITPMFTDLGNVGGLFDDPSAMAAMYDGGSWYFFVTNKGNNSMFRIDMGGTLTDATPGSATIGNPAGVLNQPSGISLIKDCNGYYAFVTNTLTSTLAEIQMASITGTYTGTSYGTVGKLQNPFGLSRVIRDHDNLYLYVVDSSNALVAFTFRQCTDVSITSSSAKNPPKYRYLQTGIHNIFLALDEGKPTMQTSCKEIYVEPIPNIFLSNDTLICEGDSVFLTAISPGAMNYIWTPNYRISDTVGESIHAWPDFTITYGLEMPYPDGCIVDTGIQVAVSKIKADAGPDRIINDGASTVLGGPLTSTGVGYTYQWTPPQFIDNTIVPDPTVTPQYDFTYYLQVTEHNDSLECTSRDTVVVHVPCNGFNLPNAFVPDGANPATNHFGLLNKQIVQLNYFRVFDRWGEMVFETKDPSQAWDGTYNGSPAPAGVYVWAVDGFCLNGKRFKRTGNVTLIR